MIFCSIKQILLISMSRFLINVLSILDGVITLKIYDKRDDFFFILIVNFPSLNGDGRVVRWCRVNFQCPDVLLIWIKNGKGLLHLQ